MNKNPPRSTSIDPLQKKRRYVTTLDLAILLFNVYRGANQAETVGFEHVTDTLQSFTKRLNRPIAISENDLEACLYSANLLSERGEFWHPKGRTFDQWVRDMVKDGTFNLDYNYLENN